MAEYETDAGRGEPQEALGEDARGGEGRRSAPLPPPPARARFPGWLLPILGAAAAGLFSGWWGAAFGGVVGFLIWRAR